MKDGQLIQNALGIDLLDDTDKGVRHNDRQKGQTAEVT